MDIFIILSVARTHIASIDIKGSIFAPDDVEKSINLSYHSLSVTLFWPGVAKWTMNMYFSTTLLDIKTDSPQSADSTFSKTAENIPHTHTPALTTTKISEEFLTCSLALSIAR